MISKEQFKKYLMFIKQQQEKEEKFVEALEELSPGTYCDCYIYDEYETMMVAMLRDFFNDKEDDISYFIYEAEGLKEEDINGPTDKDGNMLYHDIDSLYKYLRSK